MSMTRLATLAPGVLTLLAAAGLAFVAPRPTLDNRPAVWFPGTDPHLAAFRTFRARFGGDEALILVVEGGDPLNGLRLARDLTAALEEDEQTVERVTSAASAFPDETEALLDPDLGGLENLRFVGGAFQGPLNRTLHLWEQDPARATLLLTLRPGPPEQRRALLARLEPFARRAEAEGSRLRQAGEPLLNLELDRAAREVDEQAMPLLVGVCVLVLLVTTRSLRLSLSLLAPVGLGVFATDGLLGLSGVSGNLIVAIVKPLVFVLFLASGFHLAVAWVDARAAGADPAEAARRAVREKLWPTLLALLTTALGFGSLALSDVPPIRTFGWLAAAAMGLGVPLVLLGLPLLLRLSAAAAPPPAHSGERLGRLVMRVVQAGQRGAPAWLLGCALVSLLGFLGARQLVPQPRAIEYFPSTLPLRVDHDALAAHGTPLASIEALVSLPAPVGSDAALLERLGRFTAAGGAAPGLHGAVGLPLFLREAVHRTAKVDRLPDPLLAAQILRRQQDALGPFLQDDGRLLRLSFLCDDLDLEGFDAAQAALHAAFEEAFAGVPGARLELTGTYGLLLGTQRALLSTLRESLLSSALLMQLVMILALRSLRLGLAALPPNAVPVAAIFLTMWLGGVPLDVGTSMTAAIALGIAVDGTLHFLHAWRARALEETARSTGRAVVLTALVIGLGFASLISSEFGPTRHFGTLCAVAMAAALLGDLLVLPATLRVVFRSHAQQHAQAVAEGQ